MPTTTDEAATAILDRIKSLAGVETLDNVIQIEHLANAYATLMAVRQRGHSDFCRCEVCAPAAKALHAQVASS